MEHKLMWNYIFTSLYLIIKIQRAILHLKIFSDLNIKRHIFLISFFFLIFSRWPIQGIVIY